jgi:cytochrome oxidase Cu insertion factor (SCO1/SenC/PrrC family)
MVMKLALLLAIWMIGLLAACAPGAATSDAVMNQKSTEAGMETKLPDSAEMMEKSATPEMMKDQTAADEAMTEKTNAPMMATETPQASTMEEKAGMMAPAWFSASLLDAKSGETFKIEDFKGKVVLVEPFAQWCSTCLRQQKEVIRLHELLGMPDDLISVSLGIDTNEDAAMLASYMDKHGFDWRFTIASPDTAREIGSLYGQQFLNPPSAPMLIIDRQGEAHPLPFGVKSAEDLQEALKPFLSEGM